MEEAAGSLVAAVESGRTDIVRAILDAFDKLELSDGDSVDIRRHNLLNSTRCHYDPATTTATTTNSSSSSNNNSHHNGSCGGEDQLTPTTDSPNHHSSLPDFADVSHSGEDTRTAADDGGGCGGGGGELPLLHRAVVGGHVDVVRALLAAGADPAVRDWRGSTSVQLANNLAAAAAGGGGGGEARAAAVVGVFVNELFCSVAAGDVDRVRCLVTAGVDVNCADSAATGNTALHWAASFSDANTLDCLIKLGARVNEFNTAGCSALHDAVLRAATASGSVRAQCEGASHQQQQQLQLVARLVAAGADSGAVAGHGKYGHLSACDLAASTPSLLTLLSTTTTAHCRPDSGQGQAVATTADPLHSSSVTSHTGHAAAHHHVTSQTANDIASHGVLPQSSSELECVTEVSDLIRDLWPVPHSVRSPGGPCFVLDSTLHIFQSYASPDTSKLVDIWHSCRAMFAQLGVSLLLSGVSCALSTGERSSTEHSSSGGSVWYTVSPALFPSSQSYTLIVRDSEIVIKTSDACGLRYAIRTLLQHIGRCCRHDGCFSTDCSVSDDQRPTRHLAPLCVTDCPSLAHRAFLVDISACGRVPNMNHLFYLADTMAALSLNCLHLFCRFCADHWRPPYSPVELMQLEGHCCAIGVHIVPTIDVQPGVSLSLLAEHIDGVSEFVTSLPRHSCVHFGPNLTALLFSAGSCDRVLANSVQRHLLLTRQTTLMVCANAVRSQFAHLPPDVVLVEYGFQVEYNYGQWLEVAGARRGFSVMTAGGSGGWNCVAGCVDAMTSSVYGAVAAAVEHRSCGVVVADWRQTGGVTMTTAQLAAVVTAAGFSWNHNTSREYTLSQLSHLLNLFAFGGHCSTDLGRLTIQLSQIEADCMLHYQSTGSNGGMKTSGGVVAPRMPPDEGTVLLQLLTRPDSVEVQNLSAALMTKLLRRLSLCRQQLARSAPPPPPAVAAAAASLSSYALRELCVTAELMFIACRIGKALVVQGCNPMGSTGVGFRAVNIGVSNLPATVCTDLANRLLGCVDQFRLVWLDRSLASPGLSLSLLLFTRLLCQLIPESYCHSDSSGGGGATRLS